MLAKVLKFEGFMGLTNRFMCKCGRTLHYLECHNLLNFFEVQFSKFQFLLFQFPFNVL